MLRLSLLNRPPVHSELVLQIHWLTTHVGALDRVAVIKPLRASPALTGLYIPCPQDKLVAIALSTLSSALNKLATCSVR
jgi:hypothetical protein